VTLHTYRERVTFTNQLPTALSPSRLSDFLSCPRKYQHAAVDRIPQPATYATAKGIVVHYIFESIFSDPPVERTAERARSYVADAEAKTLTASVSEDIGLTEQVRATLRQEIDQIIDTYFSMEDPTAVTVEGVELRVREELGGAPILGILDRLDRAADGTLEIVDYKTGKVPHRDYDAQTFANADIYAALCEAHFHERPSRIRLLYVTHGTELERTVTEPAVRARVDRAAHAWSKITNYYDAGEFPATPSVSACRFCSFRDRCRAAGVAVP
jgi:putative RecB family exonuclease